MLCSIPAYSAALTRRLESLPNVEFLVASDAEDLGTKLPGAEVLIVNGPSYTDRTVELIREKGQSLRWFHSTSAGNDALINRGTPRQVEVTRSGGHSAPVVAEHAVALLLALARGLPHSLENQRNRRWVRNPGAPRQGTMRSLIGRTAVVLGFGPIGQEIARRLRVLEMKVIAVTRSGAPHELADETYRSDELKQALAKASALVVAAPGGPETKGMIGAEELATLQPDAFVVNIGRGSVIQTNAIEAALRNRTILGAGLDVHDPEPLPEDHTIWDAPNLIITPHRAGGGDPTSSERQAEAFVKNLEQFRRGEALSHVFKTAKWD